MSLLPDRGAIISDCQQYRYTLFRIFGTDSAPPGMLITHYRVAANRAEVVR